MDTVRFGLIGYGKVAQLHAQALKDAKGATLVSVCGRNDQRRDEFAAKWNIKSRKDVAQMVALDQIDAVIITTPHPRHHDDALEAFASGCHVLVEKPMAPTEKECTSMIIAAERANRVLGVISQRRLYPSSLRIKEAINSGKLGTPAIGAVTILGWRDENYYKSDPWRGKWETEGGGVCINQAVHQFDLLCWYMGPMKHLYAEWDNFNHPYIEVEDSAAATIRFANGGIGSVLVSNSQKPGIYAKVHIHGSSGSSVGVQTDGGAMFFAGQEGTAIIEPPINDLWTIEGEENLLAKFKKEDEEFFKTVDIMTYFFSRQIENFVEAIKNRVEPMVTGEDGREAVRLIEGIYKSGRDNSTVIFQE